MTSSSLPVIIMAGISCYVGLYHLLIYVRRRQHREDLTFALLCLATSLYEVFCFGLYNSSTVAEGAQWQRAQFIALPLFTTIFMWFVSDYTHHKPGPVLYAFSIFFLVALFVQLVDRSDLTWLIRSPAIKEVWLPLGSKITYYEATFGPFTTLQSFAGLAASTYILVIGLHFYRSGHQCEAVPLLLAMGLVYAAAFNDTAVSNGLYQFIYTIEYGYMAMILLMTYSLSSTVVEAALASEARQASEAQFRLFMQHFPGLAYIKDAATRVLFANQGFKEYLDISPADILGKTNQEVFPAEFAQQILVADQRVLETGASEVIEEHYAGRVWSTHKFVISQTDKPALLGGFTLDITERKRMEATLQMFQYTIDRASDAVQWLNREAGFEYVNDQACHSLGYTREELLRLHLWDIDPIYPQERWEKNWEGYQPGRVGGGETVETLHRRKDGSVFPVEVLSNHLWFGDRELHVAVVRDITERKQAEEALRESEERYRRLVEASPVAMWICQEGIVTYMNPAALRILGATDLRQVVGRTALDFIHPDYHAIVKERLSHMEQYKSAISALQEKYLRLDGCAVDVEVTATPLTMAGGPAVQVLFQDITARKQAEEALQEKTAELDQYFTMALDLFCIADTDGYFHRLNKEWESALGYSLQDLEGTRFLDYIHPADLDATLAAISRLAEQKEVLNFVNRYRSKDGSYRWIEWRSSPMGKMIYAAARDITERKQAEEALRESELRYRALVESQVDLISRYRPDTILTFVNDAYCQFFGKTREELLGQSYLFMIAPEYRDLVRKETESLAEEPRSLSGEYLNYRYDGQERWIQWAVRCIVDENDRVVELEAVGRDITRLKQAEAEREKLIADLEAKNAELERFTYTVSHDLKAPLITIRGFLGLLGKDARAGDDARVQADMQRIVTATEKMQRLLSELLELSRIGRLMNPSEAVPYEVIVREALELVRGRLEGRGVRVEVEADLPAVYGDRARLMEVVQNLVDNAAKFMGAQAEPCITIGQQGVDRNGQPILFVRDNGQGIEPAYQERIFGLFEKLDPQSEGTGIGLALVKRIVEVHGGRIWVESAGANQGATFFFTLPRS